MYIDDYSSILKCNRVGHDQLSVNSVCMNRECNLPIPCCRKCIQEDHKNHEIREIYQLETQSLQQQQYFIQLNELSESICNVCFAWRKEIQGLTDNIRVKLKLPSVPTLSELSTQVQNLRKTENRIGYEKLIGVYRKMIQNLKNDLEVLKNQFISVMENQQQEEIFQSNNQVSQLGNNGINFVLTHQLEADELNVEAVAISNDDKYFASSSSKNDVILWDVKSNKKIISYKTCYPSISNLQFSDDDSILAVCSFKQGIFSNDGVIEIFDMTNFKSNKAQFKLEGHNDSIESIAFGNDCRELVSVSKDFTIRNYDLNIKKQIASIKSSDAAQRGVTYSNKLKQFARCDTLGYASTFTFKNNHYRSQDFWFAHAKEALSIQFIKNSEIIMTSSYYETRFWQVDNLYKHCKLTHFKQIKDGGHTVKAHPINDPQFIINCSADYKCINIWNYDSTELIQSIEVPNELIKKSFAITSNFTKIITGGNNQKVNIFEKQ